MNADLNEFEQTADRIALLHGLDELFASCAQLMADALVNGGTIFSIGTGISASTAQQFSDMLTCSPDELRPPLPSIFLRGDSSALKQFQALAKQGDFAILFNTPGVGEELDSWLDACLEKHLTSVLINPDSRQIESTDRALEIRLEYSSFAEYLTSLSAVGAYLTKSIETQLFGRQT